VTLVFIFVLLNLKAGLSISGLCGEEKDAADI
jgi:hypothetical protein